MKNPYTILGVTPNCTPSDIKKAYKNLARRYHPDKNDDPDAVARFQEIQKAYNDLTESKSYQNHDFSGFSDFMSDQFRKPNKPKETAIRTEINCTLEQVQSGASYMFDGTQYDIPKGIRHKSLLRMGKYLVTVNVMPHAKFKRANDDLLVDVHIDAIEAMLGVSVIITLLNGKKVKVAIPSGVQPDQVIKLSKYGLPNPEFDNRVGDLLVRLKISIPTNLTDEQRNTIIKLPYRESITI